jgi:phage terminase large subunit GpA-like protein
MMISAGGYNGLWNPEITPYMVEPLNCINDRTVNVIVFAGCARSGKTNALIDGMVTYSVTCNPSDIIIVHITESTARRYARMRIGRMLTNSPALSEKLSTNRHDNNILTRNFKNGATLQIANPSPSHLAAAEFKFVALTDIDRYQDDAGGEGSIVDQAKKRTQTYFSAGKTIIESSPGRDFFDTTWRANSPHDAPPVNGVLGLYNTGDKRLWVWSCPHCNEGIKLRPGTELFNLESNEHLYRKIVKEGSLNLAKKLAKIACPHCGGEILHEQKRSLNLKGHWEPENSNPNKTRSYWLSGVCAAFQTWESLLENLFKGIKHYYDTGEEGKLKATYNVDWGVPFVPLSATDIINAEELELRAEPLEKHMVTMEVRYLVTSIDVQGRSFVVQVQGFGIDNESWLVDRYVISKSKRMSHGEYIPVDPAAYKEDWDLLYDVMDKEYEFTNGKASIKTSITVCDSGGLVGVAENSYSFWKRCYKKGLANKFYLVKGTRPNRDSTRPNVYKNITTDISSAARKAKVVNLLPLWILNTTLLKDSLHANLKRTDYGQDYIHFPDWLGMPFYREITAEYRTDKGWEKIKSSGKNESLDLLVYAKAACLILLDGYWSGRIDWQSPPPWAHPWNDNNINVTIFNTEDEPVYIPPTKRRVVRGRTKY